MLESEAFGKERPQGLYAITFRCMMPRRTLYFLLPHEKTGPKAPLLQEHSKPDLEVVDHAEQEALPVTLVGAFRVRIGHRGHRPWCAC